jgi:alanine transaminase
MEYPELLAAAQSNSDGALTTLFPRDAVVRARTLMDNIGPSVGAYSQSQGVPYIRQKVAEFIARTSSTI